MGSLQGATIVRFPDLKKANLDLTNKNAILFCHNGNRGSETAEAMSNMGIDTKFVVGGLEKWIVEGRDMTGPERPRPSVAARDSRLPQPKHLARHRHRCKEMIEKEKAILVDIRYPSEFAASHIDGRDQPQPSAARRPR